MPIANIVCPICTEVFKSSDTIHSTDCGHLFHLSCLNSWRNRESSCPQCRRPYVTSNKLCLTFEELGENVENIECMELKLKSSKDKVVELREKRNEAETNLMRLQEQFTVTVETERELQETIIQMKDMEDDFLRLQGQYTESLEALKLLEDRIQQLFIENECKSKELKNLGNQSLEVIVGAKELSLSNSNVGHVIETLEQEIKHVSEKLEKEICTSTQLLIEKMKLEGYINQKTAPQNKKGTNFAKNNNNVERKSNEKKSNEKKSSNQNNSKSASGVSIRNIPLEQFKLPLENIVINLASKMHLVVSPDDLIKVDWINDTKNCHNCQLFAQFKSPELMHQFLSHGNILKHDPTTKSILISPCMSDELHEIFLNAKEQLKNNGFDLVYKKRRSNKKLSS